VWQERSRILADLRRVASEAEHVAAVADERFPPEEEAHGEPVEGEVGPGEAGAHETARELPAGDPQATVEMSAEASEEPGDGELRSRDA
jgi:hypothetical protein